jgi:hypothetical protein
MAILFEQFYFKKMFEALTQRNLCALDEFVDKK